MTEIIWIALGIFIGCLSTYLVFNKKRLQDKLEHQKKLRELEERSELKIKEEIERVKERIQRAADRDSQNKLEALAKDLLPILDAMHMAKNLKTENVDSVKKGVDMIYSRFEKSLGNHGCTPISPEAGEIFDPNIHEAVKCSGEPEHIIATNRTGYKLGDVVLRPAAVEVGQIEIEHDSHTSTTPLLDNESPEYAVVTRTSKASKR